MNDEHTIQLPIYLLGTAEAIIKLWDSLAPEDRAKLTYKDLAEQMDSLSTMAWEGLYDMGFLEKLKELPSSDLPAEDRVTQIYKMRARELGL